MRLAVAALESCLVLCRVAKIDLAFWLARGTSTDGEYRWLHEKPLDSAIGRVLAPYRPGGRHGHRRRRRVKHKTKHNF